MEFKNTFGLENISTDLLVECIIQLIESLSTSRTTNLTYNIFNQGNEVIKQWISVTEMLIQCLKSDVKRVKTSVSVSTSTSTSAPPQKAIYDRTLFTNVICKWFLDLDYMKSFYCDVNSKVKTQETESLYNQLNALHKFAKYIYERQNKKNVERRKDEVVFIYDDSTPVFSD